MARAQDQTRWRQNNSKKRIEIYLATDTVDALDRLATTRGLSRAGVIAQLVAADQTEPRVNEPPTPRYTWRKAKGEDPVFDYEWLLIVDGEPIAGLRRDDVYGWQGKYLDASMSYKWAKGKTRDQVAFDLIDAPYIYR